MLIKLKDYVRIYKVINSVVKNEGADPSICCLFFSSYGAYILSKHFKIEAHPKAGLAAFNVGSEKEILLFGEKESGRLTGDKEAFHCWVEANGWVIDFMAPAFREIKTDSISIPSKMFQKPISEMSDSPFDLASPGDFYLESSPISTAKHMSVLSTKPAYGDLAEICAKWFRKSPRTMHSSIGIADQKGSQNKVALSGQQVIGAW